MPAAKLSPEDWQQIRTASEAGVDDITLSQDFNITRESIRKRRQLDGWLTPKKIAEHLAIAKVKAEMKGQPSSGYKSDKVSRDSQLSQKTAAETVAEQISRLAERNGLRVASMADSALRGAADSPPPVATWSDASTAYKLLRLAAGLDREGTQVTLNLGSVFQPPESGSCIEVE